MQELLQKCHELEYVWRRGPIAGVLAWDRRRLACTEREARKTCDAGETPAVPGESTRKLEASICGEMLWRVALFRQSHLIVDDTFHRHTCES
jgi:hypothetical protein